MEFDDTTNTKIEKCSPKRRKTNAEKMEKTNNSSNDKTTAGKSKWYKDLSYRKYKDHVNMDEESSAANIFDDDDGIFDDIFHNVGDDDDAPQKVKFCETEEEGELIRAVAMRHDSCLQNYVIDSIASNERKQYLHMCISKLFDEKFIDEMFWI